MGDLCSVATMPQPPAELPGYDEFLQAIKERVRVARLRAVAAANQELLRGYWEIGAEILRRQKQEGWGARVIDRLATDLRVEFPGVKGIAQPEVHARVRGGVVRWPICARRPCTNHVWRSDRSARRCARRVVSSQKRVPPACRA